MANIAEYWDDFSKYEFDNEYMIEDFVEEQIAKIEDAFSELDESLSPAHLGKENGISLYNLIRNKKPEIIVETGVANGFSSSITLKAIEENGTGELYSIDLPVKTGNKIVKAGNRTGAVIPAGKEPGWAIPKKLRKNWVLRTGNTFYQLPSLLQDLSDIDMFLHDSEHTYEAMMFEYGIAWKHLKEPGYLLSDNIEWNDAFTDFADSMNREKYRLGSVGLLEK